VCQPVIEPELPEWIAIATFAFVVRQLTYRASRNTTCTHRDDAAALVRRNVGTWDRHNDATMSRWNVGPGFPHRGGN
jgi:hypothetical protein